MPFLIFNSSEGDQCSNPFYSTITSALCCVVCRLSYVRSAQDKFIGFSIPLKFSGMKWSGSGAKIMNSLQAGLFSPKNRDLLQKLGGTSVKFQSEKHHALEVGVLRRAVKLKC